MRVLYLSAEQGAATSLYASSIEDKFLFTATGITEATFVRNSQRGGKYCGNILIPYVVPYRSCLLTREADNSVGLVKGWGWILAFECLGPFAGAQWSRSTLPDAVNEKAVDLWEFSEQLIEKIISTKG